MVLDIAALGKEKVCAHYRQASKKRDKEKRGKPAFLLVCFGVVGRYSKGRVDVEHLGPRTKIVWNKAQPPLTSKLHDFCTLMHLEPLENGSFMLVTRATEHPQARAAIVTSRRGGKPLGNWI